MNGCGSIQELYIYISSRHFRASWQHCLQNRDFVDALSNSGNSDRVRSVHTSCPISQQPCTLKANRFLQDVLHLECLLNAQYIHIYIYREEFDKSLG